MRRSSVVNLIALAVGAIGLAIVLARLGWDGVHTAIVGTGSWFALIAAIDLASVCCDAYAIYGLLDGELAYHRVFAAQASGIAINRLTPGNSLGEPVKVTMLVRYIGTEPAVTAIVLFNLTTMLIAITAIALGVPLTALLLDLPRPAAIVAWVGMAVLVGFAIAVISLVRRGALGSLVAALARLRIVSADRANRWREAVARIDAQLRHPDRARIRRGVLGVFGSRLCNWTGTLVVLHVTTGIAMTPALVVAMLSVGILVTWMSNIIPLGLGIADGANYGLYSVLGAAPETGLVFTMVNRVRTVVLAGMGLAIMAIANLARRTTS